MPGFDIGCEDMPPGGGFIMSEFMSEPIVPVEPFMCVPFMPIPLSMPAPPFMLAAPPMPDPALAAMSGLFSMSATIWLACCQSRWPSASRAWLICFTIGAMSGWLASLGMLERSSIRVSARSRASCASPVRCC